MTAATKTDVRAATEVFAVEYPCDRFCRVEVDLAGIHKRFTRNQMRQLADSEHDRLHRHAARATA